jgi:hypothetical protein
VVFPDATIPLKPEGPARRALAAETGAPDATGAMIYEICGGVMDYDSLHVERTVDSLIYDNCGSSRAGSISDVVLEVASVVLAFCLKTIDR